MLEAGETLHVTPRAGHSQFQLRVYATDGSAEARDRLDFSSSDYRSALQLLDWLNSTDAVSQHDVITFNVSSSALFVVSTCGFLIVGVSPLKHTRTYNSAVFKH